MRKLYLGNGNRQFKFADTTTEIYLSAFDDGSAAALSAGARVRIKNGSGYLLEIGANITDNHAIITSGQLAKLPVGNYLLELWDTVDDGTAIYPSDGFLALKINENVTDLSGDLVSSITVDDFIQQFSELSQELKQKVADAVSDGLKGDKGDDGLSAYQVAVINGYKGSQTEWLASLVGAKGDTGSVDNDGLIKAPAFVNLQTQVNNSAVGANLIVQSDLKRGYLRGNDGSVVLDRNDFHSDNYIATNGETVFTLSSPDYVFKGSHKHILAMYDSDKKYLGYQNITSATQTLSKSNAAYIRFSIYFLDEGGTYGHISDWLSNHRYKLEKGGVVTDWCLNPTDILTQADYAKIKAAIVALGGSLS